MQVQTWETAYRPYARIRLDDGEPGSDGLHRSWVMLMPEGEFTHPDYGKLHFDRKKLSEFKRHFDERVRKIDIAFDLDHDAKAATGWLERIAFGEEIGREPGLWGLTAWTPIGIKQLQDRIYRYFSPEFGDYTDEESGEKYHNVIIGGALTNRPFLKVMPAVKLSQKGKFERPGHYTKGDREKIAESDFAGPGRTFPIVTQQDVHDAARLVGHAANPAAVKARIKAIAKRKGFALPKDWADEASQKASDTTNSSNSSVGGDGEAMGTTTLERDDENRRIFMGKSSGGAKRNYTPADDDAEGSREQLDDASSDDSESYADEADTEGDKSTVMDDGGDSDESMDDGTGAGDDEEETPPPAAKRGSKKASKKASETFMAVEDEDEDEDEAPVTLREQRIARQLSDLRAEMTEMRRRGYADQVAKILSGWDAGAYQFSESRVKSPELGTTRTQTARVALSRPAREAISKFLLSERAFRLSEESRDEICRLFELAAKGAVDLSVRGSSFDQEERRTVRLGGQQRSDASEQEELLQQQVEAIALSEYRKPVGKLSHAELAEAQVKAAEIIGYR